MTYRKLHTLILGPRLKAAVLDEYIKLKSVYVLGTSSGRLTWVFIRNRASVSKEFGSEFGD